MTSQINKVVGLGGVMRRLKDIGDPKFTQQAVRESLIASAQIVKVAIEERAPVSTDKHTDQSTALPIGALKESIVISYLPDPVSPKVAIGPNRFTAHVARWIERGHRIVRGGYSKAGKRGGFSGPGRQVGFQPAEPFIRPAQEASQSESIAALRASFTAKVRERWGANVKSS